MASFLGWFGGGPKKDAAKDAIIALRSQVHLLERRLDHLQTQVKKQKDLAKDLLAKEDRDGAKHALRRKKQMDESLNQTQDQIISLESQIVKLENAHITKTTFEAMEGAHSALKSIHNGITVKKVEEAMDKLHDQEEIGAEINQAILRNNRNPVDDAELDAELAELEQTELDRKMLAVGPVPANNLSNQLPTVPQTAAKPVIDDEEEELRKLQAEMAL